MDPRRECFVGNRASDFNHLESDVQQVDGELVGFRDKINNDFGEFLPTNVIDELCKVVQEFSHDKCKLCVLPLESLVLSVLQILLHAAQRVDQSKDNNAAAIGCVEMNGGNVGCNYVGSATRGIHSSSSLKDFPKHCNQPLNSPINASKELAGPQGVKSMKIPAVVLETPLAMHQGNAETLRKKSKTEHHTNRRHNQRIPPCSGPFPVEEAPIEVEDLADVEVLGVTTLRDRSVQRGKITDDLYNKRNFASTLVQPVIDLTRTTRLEASKAGVSVGLVRGFVAARNTKRYAASRVGFPVSDEERGYYNIICGLAHSQWSCMKAVDICKTSVTYSSLGEYVEPMGKVDNFFIPAICRKFFEDEHPRQSKKHYFYPKVGGCLYSYNCSYDVMVCERCFVGANSAYKLHRSDKLFFPVVIGKHWFLFVVDLKNKLFVFLDSMFGANDNFQKEYRPKIINAFRECWYQYAEVKIDLEDFEFVYPPVPKQQNAFDCGIFTIKYMELWNNDVDLRQLFDQSDIPNIRVKLGVDLFFSKANCVDKSLVMNFYQQGLDPRVCN